MKLILSVFLIFSLFCSCNNRETEINGVISNYSNNSHEFVELKLYFGNYTSDFEKYKSVVNSDGNFSIKIELTDYRMGELNFREKKFPIILSPNKIIKVRIYNDSIYFINSTINDFLIQRRFYQVYGHYDLLPIDVKISPKKLLGYIEAEKNKEISKLNLTRKQLSSLDYEFLSSEINYYYRNLIIYAGFNLKWDGRFSEFNIKWCPVIDSVVLDGINSRLFHDFSYSYNFFLLQAFQFNYYKFIETKPKSFWINEVNGSEYKDYLKKIEYDDINLNSLIVYRNTLDKDKLEKALSNRLFESIEFNYYENLDQVYNYFKSEFPKSKYLNDISQRINPILDFKSQKIIDGIYFYPPDHGYKTIDSILSLPEFRNKVVLVDIWGSWCSSCRIEFNYLPALKERLKNEDIAYLYIADQKHHSIEKWKEVVNYHKVYGYHFLGNKDLMIDIWSYNPDCRGYYPTFMIFDKNRNLNLPCAAYPSDNELYNQLIKSINQ